LVLAEEEELRRAVELARLIVREAERSIRWRAQRVLLALILNRDACKGKPMRTKKRTGAMPPIVTVIIIVASVVAAALAAYFIYTTTARGVRQVSLTVIGQPTLYAANKTAVELRVTFKNDGTADVDLANSIISVQNKTKIAITFNFAGPATSSTTTSCSSSSCKLAPGDSVAVRYTASATLDSFPDGAMATLQTIDGYQTSFAVAKP
jgi:flagellar basal body-associated protein FliL